MRVCHIVPSLEERHGGPSRSVRALAGAEAGLGATVELLSTLGAGVAPPPDHAGAASVRVFPRVAPQRLCRSPGLDQHLSGGSWDCVHHHSLWLLTLRYANSAARKTGAPLVISPRGMMSRWALQHHAWRKKIASVLVHPGAIAGAAGWHATSLAEADDIRRQGITQPICVAPNGVPVPEPAELASARAAWQEECPQARNRRVALFFSRFHRKKRLLELIDLWTAKPRGDWLLLIAGVPEEYSVAELNRRVAAAGARDNIVVYDGAGRSPPFAFASLFLLPSHSENFGLVIGEALAAAVPALVTDTTPWADLNAEQAGWCVRWEDFASSLDVALGRSPAELAAMGARGREWIGRNFSWEKSARLLLEFYRSLPHG